MTDPLLSNEEHRTLLRYLARYLASQLGGSEPVTSPLPLSGRVGCGCFVTLRRVADGELRGCIGVTHPGTEPILALAERMAISACREDHRFPRVVSDELSELTLGISLLTPETRWPAPRDPTELRLGSHGLRVRQGPATGVLLPQVALAWGYDAEGFLDATCQKAGLRAGAWRDSDVEVYHFEGREMEAPLSELWREHGSDATGLPG